MASHAATMRARASARDRADRAAARDGERAAKAGAPREVPYGTEDHADAWLAGYDTQRRTGGRNPKKAPAKKRTGRARTARRTARRTVSKVPTRPAQVTSLMPAVAGTLALAVLYNALTNAEAAAGVIGGIAKAAKWLDSPRSIPYKEK